MAASDDDTLLETPLAALHRRLGGRMVPFAGYAMPVQFPAGILAEHLACRSGAALFDVSHMGQAELRGENAAAALEALTPADVRGLKPGRQRYALLTTEAGGIFDDFMVANLGDRLFLVVNASRKEEDFARIEAALPAGVTLRRLPDRALLAFQGPRAVEAVGDAGARPRRALLHGRRRNAHRRHSRARQPQRLHRRGRLRDQRARRRGGAIGRGAARPARRLARGLGRARLAPAGGRALPLRQRHRRDDEPGGSGADLDDRQAPPRCMGFSGRRPGARGVVRGADAAPRRAQPRGPAAGPRAYADPRGAAAGSRWAR